MYTVWYTWPSDVIARVEATMANVPVEFSLSLQDFEGVRGSMRTYANIVDTTTLAALATQIQTLETDIDAVTGAAIIAGRVTLNAPLVGGLKTAVAGADLERTMLLNFTQSGSAHKFGVDIPGVNPAILTAGKIDLTQAAVAALISLIEGNYTSVGLLTLTAVRDAVLSFRKRRRELNRTTAVA